ncbi:MAG TPA: alpha/beta hydrolase [Acidimicrobiales bacterium]|nr:alpha/beta hydrolase [Acidimicrobiales bacterium]
MRFVLVHGAMHGAWCWEKTTSALEALGHSAVAPDLPGHGRRQGERATLEGYRDCIVDLLEPGDVLVGHSMGGVVITLAVDAASKKVRHLIYLAPTVPKPGKGNTILDSAPRYGERGVIGGPVEGEAFWYPNIETAGERFFHDCSPEDIAWATGQLQPQPTEPITTPITLNRFWSLATPRSLITCLVDRTSVLLLAEVAEKRLGLRTSNIMRSSHSPFISRPKYLAQLFVDVVEHHDGATPDFDLIQSSV